MNTESHADFVFHGHFYQPPRENPWTDEVDREPSAYPYHDWNARIDRECYAANAAARIHDEKGRLASIVANYEWISFNFGPTLLRWMEREDPHTLARIVEADRRSRERCGGHGNAIAQVYNHIILPLADEEDRRRQIRWGRAEFVHRFGRDPEAMWLAETAADRRTLDLLIEEGLRFVILAPNQAARVRPEGEEEWTDVSGGRVDPSRAYFHRHRREPQRRLAVFFYDGPLAQAVSFGDALRDGHNLAARVHAATDPSRRHRQLVHLAVDGETAGHHQSFGELALAWALTRELPDRGYRLTNYGEYLQRAGATWEVEIDEGPFGEGTSWSCAHGVGRWIRDCGCRIDPGAPTQQAWRTPLRQALDHLRDRAKAHFQREARRYFADPEAALDGAIELLLHERSPDASAHRDRWLLEHCGRELDADERHRALTLLELRHQLLLMYTSCGWFFDDIGGIESVQVLRYAARALELLQESGGPDERDRFLRILARARSNDPRRGTGADVFVHDALAARVPPERVAAHLAMTSVLRAPDEVGRVGLHDFRRERFHLHATDGVRLATALFELRHRRTEKRDRLRVAMLHTGALEFLTVVEEAGAEEFDAWQEALHRALDEGGVEAVRTRLEGGGQRRVYGAEDLLEADRQALLEKVFEELIDRFSRVYADLYEENREVIRSLHRMGMQLPEELRAAAAFTLRQRFEEEFVTHSESDDPRAHLKARQLVREASERGLQIDSALVREAFERMLMDRVEELAERACDPDRQRFDAGCRQVEAVLETAEELRLTLDLHPAQLRLYEVFHEAPCELSEEVATGLDRLAVRLGFAPGALAGA